MNLPVFIGKIFNRNFLDEGSTSISLDDQVADHGLRGDIDLCLKSSDIPLINTDQHKIKDEILNDDIEIALYFETISDFRLGFFAINDTQL